MVSPERKVITFKEFFWLVATGVAVFLLTGTVGIFILDEIGCERLGGPFEGKCGWVAVGYLVQYGIPVALVLWAVAGYCVLRRLRRHSRHM